MNLSNIIAFNRNMMCTIVPKFYGYGLKSCVKENLIQEHGFISAVLFYDAIGSPVDRFDK